jgi:hypothetical protein
VAASSGGCPPQQGILRLVLSVATHTDTCEIQLNLLLLFYCWQRTGYLTTRDLHTRIACTQKAIDLPHWMATEVPCWVCETDADRAMDRAPLLTKY